MKKSNLSTKSKTELIQEIERLHTHIHALEEAFDSALQVVLERPSDFFEAQTLAQKKVKALEEALDGVIYNLFNEETDFRQTLVRVMTVAIEYWEKTTKKTKIELAEDSRIWGVYLDRGLFQTRTLDKYLKLSTLPKNPRWRDVLRTARFTLEHCKLEDPLRKDLEAGYAELQNILTKLNL